MFAARVPHSSINFTHRAWVGDGRPKHPSDVKFEPRPVVTKTDAWVRLPKFLGARPDGKPYETYQAQGEITGLANSGAKVTIAVQKPISEAKLTLIARTRDGTGEYSKLAIPMFPGEAVVIPTGETVYPAEVEFDLAPDLIAYQVDVKDLNGFANATPPRRGIQISPDDPPVVRLLPERYAEPGTRPSDEDIIEGLPIPIGGQVPIAYTCRSMGVGRARRDTESTNAGRVCCRSRPSTRGEVGRVRAARSTFANASMAQVEFFFCCRRPTATPPITGGGGLRLQTAELPRSATTAS